MMNRTTIDRPSEEQASKHLQIEFMEPKQVHEPHQPTEVKILL